MPSHIQFELPIDREILKIFNYIQNDSFLVVLCQKTIDIGFYCYAFKSNNYFFLSFQFPDFLTDYFLDFKSRNSIIVTKRVVEIEIDLVQKKIISLNNYEILKNKLFSCSRLSLEKIIKHGRHFLFISDHETKETKKILLANIRDPVKITSRGSIISMVDQANAPLNMLLIFDPFSEEFKHSKSFSSIIQFDLIPHEFVLIDAQENDDDDYQYRVIDVSTGREIYTNTFDQILDIGVTSQGLIVGPEKIDRNQSVFAIYNPVTQEIKYSKSFKKACFITTAKEDLIFSFIKKRKNQWAIACLNPLTQKMYFSENIECSDNFLNIQANDRASFFTLCSNGLVSAIIESNNQEKILLVFDYLKTYKIFLYNLEYGSPISLQGPIIRANNQSFLLDSFGKAYSFPSCSSQSVQATDLIAHQDKLIYRKYSQGFQFLSSSVFVQDGQLSGSFNKVTSHLIQHGSIGRTGNAVTVQGPAPCGPDISNFFILNNKVTELKNVSFYNVGKYDTIVGCYKGQPAVIHVFGKELSYEELSTKNGVIYSISSNEEILGGQVLFNQGVLWIKQKGTRYRQYLLNRINIIQGISEEGKAAVGIDQDGRPCVCSFQNQNREVNINYLSEERYFDQVAIAFLRFKEPVIHISSDGTMVACTSDKHNCPANMHVWYQDSKKSWKKIKTDHFLPTEAVLERIIGFDNKNNLLINFSIKTRPFSLSIPLYLEVFLDQKPDYQE